MNELTHEEIIKAKAIKMFNFMKKNSPDLLATFMLGGEEAWLNHWKKVFEKNNYQANEKDFQDLKEIFSYIVNWLIDRTF